MRPVITEGGAPALELCSSLDLRSRDEKLRFLSCRIVFFQALDYIVGMFKITVTPRFGDMDVLGHINNTVPAGWFELARNPLFKIFDPSMELSHETWPLIMAHTDYDFVDQLYFQHDVEIRTWISHIGNKSFTIYHEAWQTERLCVKGSAVVVHYDFSAEKSTPLPGDKKQILSKHMKED